MVSEEIFKSCSWPATAGAAGSDRRCPVTGGRPRGLERDAGPHLQQGICGSHRIVVTHCRVQRQLEVTKHGGLWGHERDEAAADDA